jgi:hypothetical protein
MVRVNCLVCQTRLEYSGNGRPPSYCSSRCKKRAAREKARFSPFRRRRKDVSDRVSAPLTHAEKVAILGREPYSGDFEGYLRATGRRL